MSNGNWESPEVANGDHEQGVERQNIKVSDSFTSYLTKRWTPEGSTYSSAVVEEMCQAYLERPLSDESDLLAVYELYIEELQRDIDLYAAANRNRFLVVIDPVMTRTFGSANPLNRSPFSPWHCELPVAVIQKMSEQAEREDCQFDEILQKAALVYDFRRTIRKEYPS